MNKEIFSKTTDAISGAKKTTTTRDLVYCAMFTVLIAAGAFIKIPIPVVPFTLQFLFTMMAGLLVSSGIGVLILFRVNDDRKANFKILFLLYTIGVVSGILLNLIWG